MSGAMNRLMMGYARAPYARVADEQNRMMLPFEEQTPPDGSPPAVTPGEMPDLPMPYGSPMAPPPPQLHGRAFVSGTAPPVDNWTTRLPSIRPGDQYADTGMAGAVVPRPGTDPGIANVPQGNLYQAPVIGDDWRQAGAIQAGPPDPRTDPAGYQNWLLAMRQRGAI